MKHNNSKNIIPLQEGLELKRMKRNIEMFFGRCKKHCGKSLTIKGMDAAIQKSVTKNNLRKKS